MGIPLDNDQANSKILLTTQSLKMYRQMMTNQDVRACNLNEEEAGKSFVQNAGDIVSAKKYYY